MHYLGLNIEQCEEFSIAIDGNEKLSSISTIPISLFQGNKVDCQIKLVERKSFASFNASRDCLCTTLAPLCLELASRLLGRSRMSVRGNEESIPMICILRRRPVHRTHPQLLSERVVAVQ